MDDPRARLRRSLRRLRRVERREAATVRRWLEDTENLLHVSVLLFVPLTIAGVTGLANAIPSLSFLLFPPLASGAYTLFSDPEGRYSAPTRFVAGMTIGAVCGWIALVVFGNGGGLSVNAWSAGLAVLLTGAATWLLHVEEPAAYSVALLLLVQEAPPEVYVASVAVASGLTAIVYETWHDTVYEHRAEFLYASTGSDDDVLVPLVDGAESVVRLGASVAAGHEGGRVVLLGVVAGSGGGGAGTAADASDEGAGAVGAGTDETVASGDDRADDEATPDAAPTVRDAPDDVAGGADTPEDRAVADLEARAADLRSTYDVECEVVVARGSDPTTVTLETARETGCDIVLAPFGDDPEESFVTSLFVPDLDVAAARAARSQWDHVLVPIRSAGDLAHLKVDLARRIAGDDGRVTVAHCIAAESGRRHAEDLCANVVDAYDGRFETLVANTSIEAFLADHAASNDLIVMGASTDRTRVSRLLSRPTYRRVTDLPTDLLVVHAGRR